ncbi:MAG: 1-deoxy-D-xylulose-5-phosphate synthase, partial [Clostridia bacterium]|nr:1-deoxy-D-xylulose-5-phosphate synthase [Clostridia bacterium]
HTVSKNGGHLASNLGMVEATIAIHKAFDLDRDKLIFDVGHQCYTHKLLTGRDSQFHTLRQYNGLSGFCNRKESKYDVLNEGHCGTSISSALGVAIANKLQGNEAYTIAVVGDGALTNGMIYEALNNCADKCLKLIILINDNEMSISKNVGGLHSYLSSIRTSKRYFSFKRTFEGLLNHIPLIGKVLARAFRALKNFFRKCFLKNTLFEDIGLTYLGPVDGNDIEKLLTVLEEAKKKNSACVIHMRTIKGLGYKHAEEHPELYHSVGPFDIENGVSSTSDLKTFSSIAGESACRLANSNDKVCAITAAMCDGTGLSEFSNKYPDRFFDVGIAEEHAVTFASGLAVNGMKPILMLYSTFSQRIYDQIFHDVCIQKLPMILALDRCGIVPGDGITHQGIFDYSIFSSLPNVTIFAPESYKDLENFFDCALDNSGLSIIRYPKGVEQVEYEKRAVFVDDKENFCCYTENVSSKEIVIITYGRISRQAYGALELLKDKYSIGMIKLKQIFPINYSLIDKLTSKAKLIYIVEEGVFSGGVGEKLSANLKKDTKTIFVRAIEEYVEHGSMKDLLEHCKLTDNQLAEEIDRKMGEIVFQNCKTC